MNTKKGQETTKLKITQKHLGTKLHFFIQKHLGITIQQNTLKFPQTTILKNAFC